MKPWFGEEERLAVDDYMKSGGFITEFKKTQEFEQHLASYTGAKYCVATNNGTVALTLAALACGIKAGDEVIVPNYTMIATASSLVLIGAKPVFVDVEPSTLCLDLKLVRRFLTPKTKAIILVAANGRSPSYGVEAIKRLCQEKGLIFLEDAAQALGSRHANGLHVGRSGLAGTFSFSTPKIISTGQGGAVITDDPEINARMRKLKDFGRLTAGTDVHDVVGYNFKFTDIQACIGLAQIKKLEDRIAKKKHIYERYQDGLQNIPDVRLIKNDISITSPWFVEIITNQRSALKSFLEINSIGSRVMYPPLNQQGAFGIPGEYPISEYIGKSGLWLPSFSQLTDEQISKVCNTIGKFFGS